MLRMWSESGGIVRRRLQVTTGLILEEMPQRFDALFQRSCKISFTGISAIVCRIWSRLTESGWNGRFRLPGVTENDQNWNNLPGLLLSHPGLR